MDNLFILENYRNQWISWYKNGQVIRQKKTKELLNKDTNKKVTNWDYTYKGLITKAEPDILESKVQWPLEKVYFNQGCKIWLNISRTI